MCTFEVQPGLTVGWLSTHLSSHSTCADAALLESQFSSAILMHFATESAYTAGIEYLGRNSAWASAAMHFSSCALPKAVATWQMWDWGLTIRRRMCAMMPWLCLCGQLLCFASLFVNTFFSSVVMGKCMWTRSMQGWDEIIIVGVTYQATHCQWGAHLLLLVIWGGDTKIRLQGNIWLLLCWVPIWVMCQINTNQPYVRYSLTI